MTKNQILSRLRAKGHITEEEYQLLKEERPQISCFTCKYDYKDATDEPCDYCEKHSKWQAKVEGAKND